MYLFFDSAGTLLETINDKALRQGNYNYNKIYVYIQNSNEPDSGKIKNDIVSLTGNFKLSTKEIVAIAEDISRPLQDGLYNDTFIHKPIPYDRNRDLKHFVYGRDYEFFVVDIPSGVINAEVCEQSGCVCLSKNGDVFNVGGTVLATLQAISNASRLSLERFAFTIEDSVMVSDNQVSGSEFAWLLGEYIDGAHKRPIIYGESYTVETAPIESQTIIIQNGVGKVNDIIVANLTVADSGAEYLTILNCVGIEKDEDDNEIAREYMVNVAYMPNTRVKGNAETQYRQGDVNITAENVGLGNVANERQYSENNPPPYDSTLSSSSENAIQNAVVAQKFAEIDEQISILQSTVKKPIAVGDYVTNLYIDTSDDIAQWLEETLTTEQYLVLYFGVVGKLSAFYASDMGGIGIVVGWERYEGDGSTGMTLYNTYHNDIGFTGWNPDFDGTLEVNGTADYIKGDIWSNTDFIWQYGKGETITVDTELSTTSENPVQNAVVSTKLNEVENKFKTKISVGDYVTKVHMPLTEACKEWLINSATSLPVDPEQMNGGSYAIVFENNKGIYCSYSYGPYGYYVSVVYRLGLGNENYYEIYVGDGNGDGVIDHDWDTDYTGVIEINEVVTSIYTWVDITTTENSGIFAEDDAINYIWQDRYATKEELADIETMIGEAVTALSQI